MTPSRVKQIRKALGMTQRRLSEHLGVHLVTVKKWETGAYPIGRQAAVRLWLLEQEALARRDGEAAEGDGDARALVEALAHPDGGGVIGVESPQAALTGSVVVGGKVRSYRRVDCPGRAPGFVFVFDALSPEEFEAARQALLERALARVPVAGDEIREGGSRAQRRRLDAWVRPDWLRRNGVSS